MAKTLALGTVLRVEDPATPGSYVVVGSLSNVPAPGPTKGETEVTTLDSVAREFLGTLPDNGELSLSGVFEYADAGQVILLDDAHDTDSPERLFQVDFTNQDVRFAFSGWVKSFVPAAGGPDDPYTFDATVRVTGAVTTTSPIV